MKRLVSILVCVFGASLYAAQHEAPLASSNNQTKQTEEILPGKLAARNEGAISSNPAISYLITGTGKMFQHFGLDPWSGLHISGAWIADATGFMTRVVSGKKGSGNSLFIIGSSIDTNQFIRLPGGTFNAEIFRFDGKPTNLEAGVVSGIDNLTVFPFVPTTRLFQLWYRQEFMDKRFNFTVGRQVVLGLFGNLTKPKSLLYDELAPYAITGLLWGPVFINPIMYGIFPGIYFSPWGLQTECFLSKSTYMSLGFFQGDFAHTFDSIQTPTPKEGSYHLAVLEGGTAWRLSGDKPGSFTIGAWTQTGLLSIPTTNINEKGATGTYMFATQRIWWAHPGADLSGATAFAQFGISDSITRPVHMYMGLGCTFYGLVPGRTNDSFGFGLGNSWLNTRYLPRDSEFTTQLYYQASLGRNTYFISALSYVPDPGLTKKFNNVVAFSGRFILLF